MNSFAKKVVDAELGTTHLFSVGQAGFIIKSKSGQLLGIDLYLSECVERAEGHMGFKRLLPQILSAGELKFDYIIATHPHFDHYDQDAIPELVRDDNTSLFVSKDCQQFISDAEIDENKVSYVKPGDIYNNGDFTLVFINCDHGTGAPDAVGVIVGVDNMRILEVGDSCLRLDRVDEYLKLGTLDVMIAPINGAYGNLNERECAILSDALKPDITIPCHYGMFASHGGNPGVFMEIMNKEYPNNKYLLMAQGERVVLN